MGDLQRTPPRPDVGALDGRRALILDRYIARRVAAAWLAAATAVALALAAIGILPVAIVFAEALVCVGVGGYLFFRLAGDNELIACSAGGIPLGRVNRAPLLTCIAFNGVFLCACLGLKHVTGLLPAMQLALMMGVPIACTAMMPAFAVLVRRTHRSDYWGTAFLAVVGLAFAVVLAFTVDAGSLGRIARNEAALDLLLVGVGALLYRQADAPR